MRYYLIILSSVFVFSAISTNALACTCAWGGPFMKVARNTEVIVQAKVVTYDRKKQSMIVKITEVYSGNIKRKNIRVWGDNGMLCRPYVTTFPIGSEWVFALNGQGSKPKYNSDNRYAISVCGAYWLRVRGNKVIGYIDKGKSHRGGQQEITQEVFRRRVRAINKNH